MRIITLLYYISFKRIIITEYIIPINFELLVNKRLVTNLSPFIIIFNIYIGTYTGMKIVCYISV